MLVIRAVCLQKLHLHFHNPPSSQAYEVGREEPIGTQPVMAGNPNNEIMKAGMVSQYLLGTFFGSQGLVLGHRYDLL